MQKVQGPPGTGKSYIGAWLSIVGSAVRVQENKSCLLRLKFSLLGC